MRTPGPPPERPPWPQRLFQIQVLIAFVEPRDAARWLGRRPVGS